ncbi:MAG TPA: protein kinase, partial [Pirellulales bacterium]
TGFELADRRYQVTHLMGQGGMAAVYHALDRRLKSEVVIKVPHQRMLAIPEFAARFTREVHALCEVTHPHVVHVLDVGMMNQTPFAVLQHLPGGSLEDRLRPDGAFGSGSSNALGTPGSSGSAGSSGSQGGAESGWIPTDLDSVLGWVGKIASALDYIHSKGVVHRDVKPGNILFDGSDNPYLSDFGVVKVLGDLAAQPSAESLTSFGSVLGTLRFMAPEVLAGLPFDGRADQFALAVSVYLALTGRYPFQGSTPVSVLYQQSVGRPRPLHEVHAVASAAASPIVLKALHREPGERYATCTEFAAALAQTLAPAASQASPTSASAAPRAAEPPEKPLTARLAVRGSLRRVRHEARLILLAHGAEIREESDEVLAAALPMRQTWLQRWWSPVRPAQLRATILPSDDDPRQASELSLLVHAEARALTDEERRLGRTLLDEVADLLEVAPPKPSDAAPSPAVSSSPTASSAPAASSAHEISKGNFAASAGPASSIQDLPRAADMRSADARFAEDSVSSAGGSTLARAADIVDVSLVGQDLGFVCRVVKAGPQGIWLIAGSEIPQGSVDVAFAPHAPKQRGRIVRTVKRSDGTYAIGVGFVEPYELPPRLAKLLKN